MVVLSRSASAEVYFAISYLARPGNLHPKNIFPAVKKSGREVAVAERVQGGAWTQVFGIKSKIGFVWRKRINSTDLKLYFLN